MEAFIITLREGVEAALVVALVLTYLRRTGRTTLVRWVYAGLALAIAASVLGAFAFSRLGFDPENPVYEGTLMAVAAVLVLTLVTWMWRASRTMKQRVEGRLAAITSGGSRQGWGLLAFVFVMVAREGIEMVLFLAALSLTGATDLLRLAGGVAGLLLAATFGVLFVRGSVHINLRRFFGVTALVLVVLAVRLAAGSVHEFIEAGLFPAVTIVDQFTEFLVQDTASTVLLLVLVALPFAALLPDLLRRPAAPAAR